MITSKGKWIHSYISRKKKLITDYCFSCLCLVVASLRAETWDLLEPILVFERQRELIIEDLSPHGQIANIYSHNMSFPQHVTHYRSLLTNESFYTLHTHILKNWGYYRLLPESVVGVNLDRSDVLSKYKASASLIGLIAGDTNIIIV